MSCPKKLEKFNNFVTNSFKIKDDSVSACVMCSNQVTTKSCSQNMCRSRSNCGSLYRRIDLRRDFPQKKLMSTKTIIIPLCCVYYYNFESPKRRMYRFPFPFVMVMVRPNLVVSRINSRIPSATTSGLKHHTNGRGQVLHDTTRYPPLTQEVLFPLPWLWFLGLQPASVQPSPSAC